MKVSQESFAKEFAKVTREVCRGYLEIAKIYPSYVWRFDCSSHGALRVFCYVDDDDDARFTAEEMRLTAAPYLPTMHGRVYKIETPLYCTPFYVVEFTLEL